MKAQRLSIAAHNAARAWGGGEIAQTALLDGLRRRGHEVVFYCNHDVVAKEAAALGIESRISYLGGDAALHHAWRFARVLRRQQPDALILGFYSKNLLAALGGRLARVPRVVARIELQRSKPSLKYRFVLNTWVDTIVTVADSVRRVYLAAGYAAQRVVTIHNAFEFGSPTRPPEAVRRSLRVPAGAPLVGAVGRLVSQKRFDRLLHAVALLSADVHCVIVGEGEVRRELETLAEDLQIRDRVHLPGWRRDVSDILVIFDVFALTSDFEGLAIAMTEAMAAGVPVVSTRVSGAEETLGAGERGAAPGIIVGFDAREIAEAIAELLSDPQRRSSMGAAGRRLIADRFSFDRMLDRWEAVLRGDLGLPARPS